MLARMFGSLFSAMPSEQDGRIRVIEAAEVRRWVDAGEAVLIDVREAGEFAAERIPGSTNLPLSAFDPAKVSPPAGKKLVIHCRSGQRCGMAASRLLSSGFEGEINRLQGGIIGWKAAGGPTRAG